MSNPREIAIENMINHAKLGDFNALKDLVKILSPYENSQEILTEIYLAEKSTDEQREFITRQKLLFSKQKYDAIQNLIAYSKKGDITATKDLITLLRPCDYSQKVLSDIYISKKITNSQKEYISSQKTLFSKHKLRKSLGIKLAKEGDIEALTDIISVLETKLLPDNYFTSLYGNHVIYLEQDILDALVEIFFSSQSSPEQKKLIWSHKDMIVAIYYNKEEEMIMADIGFKLVGTGNYRVDKNEVSFYNYIKSRLSTLTNK